MAQRRSRVGAMCFMISLGCMNYSIVFPDRKKHSVAWEPGGARIPNDIPFHSKKSHASEKADGVVPF
jgi:hypothetical protein